jgi:hypothetical protein
MERLPVNEWWQVWEELMIRGLARLGIDTEVHEGLRFRGLLRAIRERHPVIIDVEGDDWEIDHWTVVRGLSARSRRVWLTNMSSGDCPGLRADGSLAWDELRQIWGGYSLVCKSRE